MMCSPSSKKAESGKKERIETLKSEGYAYYTASAGSLGYDDAKLHCLCQEDIDTGSHHCPQGDRSRPLPDNRDANQVWEVDQAINWVKKLAFAKPFFIEEQTSPDDVSGHRKIRVAIGLVKGGDR